MNGVKNEMYKSAVAPLLSFLYSLHERNEWKLFFFMLWRKNPYNFNEK